MYGTLNDPHFIFLALSCAAVITIGSLVTALNRIPRAEFARLQNDLKELSERVRVLDAAEQRRLVMELNSHSEGAEAKYATNREWSIGGGKPCPVWLGFLRNHLPNTTVRIRSFSAGLR